MRKVWLSLSLVAALGCATTQSASTAAATPDSDDGVSVQVEELKPGESTAASPSSSGSEDEEVEMVCVTTSAVGSHIPKRVCRPRYKAKQDRDEAQRMLEMPRTNPTQL